MNKKIRIFYLVLAILGACYISYSNHKTYNESIYGVIESISYNSKGYPKISIKDETYVLSFGKEEIQVGDSISKSSETYWVFQFRDGRKIGSYEW